MLNCLNVVPIPPAGSASPLAVRRLQKDYANLMANPIDGILALPNEVNILEWHYCFKGSPDTPFEGGYYWGKLIFKENFPWSPPAVIMITPSRRFDTNVRLCMSISDYHPELWNPAWTVSSILIGLQSFMNENKQGAGSVRGTPQQQRDLAAESKEFNVKFREFRRHFPDYVEQWTGVRPFVGEPDVAPTMLPEHATPQGRVVPPVVNWAPPPIRPGQVEEFRYPVLGAFPHRQQIQRVPWPLPAPQQVAEAPVPPPLDQMGVVPDAAAVARLRAVDRLEQIGRAVGGAAPAVAPPNNEGQGWLLRQILRQMDNVGPRLDAVAMMERIFAPFPALDRLMGRRPVHPVVPPMIAQMNAELEAAAERRRVRLEQIEVAPAVVRPLRPAPQMEQELPRSVRFARRARQQNPEPPAPIRIRRRRPNNEPNF